MIYASVSYDSPTDTLIFLVESDDFSHQHNSIAGHWNGTNLDIDWASIAMVSPIVKPTGPKYVSPYSNRIVIDYDSNGYSFASKSIKKECLHKHKTTYEGLFQKYDFCLDCDHKFIE
jgi:hypothetical protein